MGDPLPPILLFFAIISSVVVITVFFLVIPLRVSLSFRSRDGVTKGILAGSWFIVGSEVQLSAKDPQLSVLVCGARVLTRPLPAFKTPAKKPPAVPGPARVSGALFPLLSLCGPVLDALLDLIRHTRFDYARGTARIGLGDPGATGMLYGLYWAMRPLVPVDRVSLIMIPEFSQEVCEIDLSTRFHIMYPARIMVNAVKILKSPETRNVIKTFRKKPGAVNA